MVKVRMDHGSKEYGKGFWKDRGYCYQQPLLTDELWQNENFGLHESQTVHLHTFTFPLSTKKHTATCTGTEHWHNL